MDRLGAVVDVYTTLWRNGKHGKRSQGTALAKLESMGKIVQMWDTRRKTAWKRTVRVRFQYIHIYIIALPILDIIPLFYVQKYEVVGGFSLPSGCVLVALAWFLQRSHAYVYCKAHRNQTSFMEPYMQMRWRATPLIQCTSVSVEAR